MRHPDGRFGDIAHILVDKVGREDAHIDGERRFVRFVGIRSLNLDEVNHVSNSALEQRRRLAKAERPQRRLHGSQDRALEFGWSHIAQATRKWSLANDRKWPLTAGRRIDPIGSQTMLELLAHPPQGFEVAHVSLDLSNAAPAIAAAVSRQGIVGLIELATADSTLHRARLQISIISIADTCARPLMAGCRRSLANRAGAGRSVPDIANSEIEAREQKGY